MALVVQKGQMLCVTVHVDAPPHQVRSLMTDCCSRRFCSIDA
jgi:hypothetical protein